MPKVRSIGLVLFSFPLNSWSDLATLVNCKDSGQEGSGVGLRRRRVHGGVGPGPHPRGPRTTRGGPQSSSPWAKLPVVRAGAPFSGPSQCSVLLSRRACVVVPPLRLRLRRPWPGLQVASRGCEVAEAGSTSRGVGRRPQYSSAAAAPRRALPPTHAAYAATSCRRRPPPPSPRWRRKPWPGSRWASTSTSRGATVRTA